ncbi:hypothetical protein GGTG_05351 [Gaeumannomyces tritici R3-111a-1]|uniref:Uncharacterized protein n=1 Tax=Gaeumannomyces tritici (strain R3-111a-1) TaxID=644352 RepID=J3NVN8_GAET3|nr:hypothetical protein GGTG_05351 [Gaeumannomyces tritici R3-111a-1]EJT75416.1 hypothetical protein GGTG_05351 [Gaeumannomyces tritici R3-111a-1]
MPRKSAPSKMKKKVASEGHGPAGPTSPPQTPRSSSPPSKENGGRAKGGSPVAQKHQEKRGRLPSRQRFGTHPAAGNGFSFSDYHPDSFRREQLSPRSSAPSSYDDSDDESSSSDSPPRSHSSTESIKPSVRSPRRKTPVQDDARRRAQPVRPPRPPPTAAKAPFVATRIIVEATFEVYELDGSDDGQYAIIRPDVIEYAESERSRSRSRPRQDHVDRKIASDFRALVFSSSSEDEDEDEYMKHVQRMREEKRRKRMSSGSIGKRTISERGSDSDREDLLFQGYINAAGHQESGEMRRMRRRLGNRHSLHFQDPPPPRIDELEEPDSGEEILDLDDSELLARELPFYDYVSMEIDSS